VQTLQLSLHDLGFFECFGEEGAKVLKEVISSIPPDIPVILDCKRGDIDTTAAVSAKTIVIL
jgi:uridine monophosphate synthetase